MNARTIRALLAGAVGGLGILACSLRDTSYLDEGSTPSIQPITEAAADQNVADVIAPDVPVVVDGGPTRTSTVVVANLFGPRLLTQDDTTLYWVTSDGNLNAIKKDETMARVVAAIGNVATQLVAEPAPGPSLFYMSATEIFSVPKAGGTPTRIALVTNRTLVSIATDSANVFAIAHDAIQAAAPATVERFLHDGGSGTVMRNAGNDGLMNAIALLGNDVFWDEGQDTFYALPKTASTATAPTTFASTAGNMEDYAGSPRAFAVDDKAFYYSDGFGVRTLARLPQTASAQLFGSETNDEVIKNVAIDETSVYAIETTAGGTLRRIAKKGGAVELMLDKLDKPNGLVVDKDFVYITLESAAGALIKCPR